MNIISTILGSHAIMYITAFIFSVLCIKCLLHGIMGGTSVLLRILCTLLFACLAYYCYKHALTLNSPNVIDDFIHDTWFELKQLISYIKTKF